MVKCPVLEDVVHVLIGFYAGYSGANIGDVSPYVLALTVTTSIRRGDKHAEQAFAQQRLPRSEEPETRIVGGLRVAYLERPRTLLAELDEQLKHGYTWAAIHSAELGVGYSIGWLAARAK